MEKILVADDEKNIADLIAYAFQREGYAVRTVYDGEETLNTIKSYNPMILIIDVMMPKINGFEVLKSLEHRENMGIIMLTAKDDIVDKVLGLELGADDYITKPFDIREVIARAKSLIRRLNKPVLEYESQELKIGELNIIIDQRKVFLRSSEIEFTPKEFDLLVILASNMKKVYTREDLLDKVWGMEYIGGTRTVDIHVQRIRKKLGCKYENIIQTVYRVGYRAIGEMYED